MCVSEFQTGSDTDSIGESRPSQEDTVFDEYHATETDTSRGTPDRNGLSVQDESVSLFAQQEIQSEYTSEVQSSLLCFATISASATFTPLTTTLKRSHSSEHNVWSSTNISYTSHLKDEEHFDISPQISKESGQVFNDEHCQIITGMGAEAIISQVMAPNHHCTIPILSLPLSLKETEEFDEIKSLEAINMVVSASGDPAPSSDLQNIDTTPFNMVATVSEDPAPSSDLQNIDITPFNMVAAASGDPALSCDLQNIDTTPFNMVYAASGDSALSPDLQNIDTTPFVKEELKEKIKRRRKQRGLPSLKVEKDLPKPDILTPAEEEKRILRRERNRLAAAKCRRKKKAKAQANKHTNQFIIDQNNALMEEKNELMEEKAKLQAMLRKHLNYCNRNDVVMIEVPEVTSFKINTSQLEISDSDSLGDEGMTFLEEESLSSDSESIDLTDDVSDQILDPSLIEAAMADENEMSHNSESLHQAVALLNSFGGDCF